MNGKVRFSNPALAVARTTATELCGQPVVMMLLVAGMLLTALVPLLHFHDFGEPGRICRDSGLAYQLVIGTVLAVAACASSIHAEITEGTALAALGKPISRSAFLFGKWLGVMQVTFRFWFCMLASSMVAWRVPQRFADFGDDGAGYVTDGPAQCALLLVPVASLLLAACLHNRRHFRFCKTTIAAATALSALLAAVCALFNTRWQFAPSAANLDFAAPPASLLVLFALAVYGAIATALSTRLPAAPVLVVSLALVALGLSADSIAAASPLLAMLPLPNLQSFWMCDAVAAGGALPPFYLAKAFAYAAACIALALGAGMLLFQTRDIG